MRLATVLIRDAHKLVLCFDGHVFDIARIWEELGTGEFRIDLGLPPDPPAFSIADYLKGQSAAYGTMRRFHDAVFSIWQRGQKTALSGAVFREEELTWLCPYPRPLRYSGRCTG